MTKTKSTGGTSLRQKRSNPFSIDYKSEVDDRVYKGKFVSKKLSIRDLAALGVRKAQLNGGMHYDLANPGQGVDVYTDDFNNMIAHLELSIVDAPNWWDLDEITDVDLISVVYKEVVKFENKFLGRGTRDESVVGGESNGSSEAGGSGDTSGSRGDRDSDEMVDEQVQSALEP